MRARISMGDSRAAAQDMLACAWSYKDHLDEVTQGSKGGKPVRVRNKGVPFFRVFQLHFFFLLQATVMSH